MMKKTSVAFIFILCFSFNITAQKDTITQRIILIGDGGSLTNGRHPVRDAVRKLIPLDKKTTVLFLGDNIYPSGLQDEELYNYDDGKAALDSQLAIADGTDAKIIMIPGNHDWDEGKRTGYEGILREQIYVDYFSGKKNVNFLPKDGCPGPVEVSLSNDVTLVLFDSQWWLHQFDKPGVESDCDCKTEDELLSQLQDILNRNLKKLVIFACHHPFKSNGIHGGNYTIKQHLFPFTDIRKNLYVPLPVIGSIYPIARSVFGTPQDLPHPNYVNMINKISAVAKSHPNLVFVAGHEHNLQLIQDSSFSYIVSGGGCKSSRVSKTKRSPYVIDAPGFVVLEVSTNKNLTSAFYTVEAGATMPADSIKRAYDTTLLNFSVIPEPVQDSTVRIVKPGIRFKDTVNISASDKYPLLTGLKKYMIGQNYRPEWGTVVNMNVFDLKTVKGGLKITGIGGGKQTKSLKLVDKKGKQWVLRSVDKNPTKALPENFRGSLAQDLVQEFNSAAHPYAALTIPTMAKALKISAPTPELFFVPDDPELGFYRQLFANTVCMLEETDVTTDGSDTKSTAKIFSKMLEDNDHRADQFAVLKARLLDILIGDFDRHFDQWKWATTDTGKGKLYYPIPKDRDQAYFFSNGKLIKIASKKMMPFLSGFKNKIENVDWLGFSARDFDRLFLTDLDREEWMKTVLEFQRTLTDDIIRKAIKKLPPEVFSINGETLINKLISRRDMLAEAAMEYYRFISRKVFVLGSNKKEYFKVSMDKNDTLHLKVFAREIGKDTGFVMYERKFNPATTHELQLYGLNGNDLFDIDENVKSKIKIRIIGGKGNDTFDIKGNTKVLLYDIKAEGNNIRHSGKETKNRFSKDPPVNTNSFTGFRYNKTKFPKILLGANAEEGFLAGIGFERTTHGFRNLPYSTNQEFSALYSVSHNGYHVNYLGEFNHITRNTDLVLKGEMKSPSLNFFFGLGNNSKLTQPVSSGFYRACYNAIELQAMLRKRYSDIFHFSIGPYFYHYQGKYQKNNGKVLGNPAALGLDSADIFSKKTYLGGKAILLIDNRNNDFFPTRGVIWNTEFVSAAGIGSGSNSITRLSSDMRVYASWSDPAKLVAVLGLGGGRIYSKNFEYFQALSLGADQNLHGFRKNRYMGKSSLYGSLELKVKLFEIKSYILPGPFGITGFYDIGRVWMPNEVSKKWHGAFGGGFYFLPFHAFTITATAGFSNSERIFNFSLGTKVNLTY
jgi:hypothetical protein